MNSGSILSVWIISLFKASAGEETAGNLNGLILEESSSSAAFDILSNQSVWITSK